MHIFILYGYQRTMRSAYKIRLRDYEEYAKGYEDAKGCVGAELTSWILKGLKLKI